MSLKIKLESKVMHDQYIISMDRHRICEENTFLWLSRVDVKGETESGKRATQDQANILQRERDGRCRLCRKFDETLEHVLSACPILAKE
jgi:hypothetical protein